MQIDLVKFGKALKDSRLSMTPPMTQFWVTKQAESLGCSVTEGTIKALENGHRKPSDRTLNLLCRIFPNLKDFV